MSPLRSGRTLLGTPPALLSPSLLLGGGPDPPSSRAHWTHQIVLNIFACSSLVISARGHTPQASNHSVMRLLQRCQHPPAAERSCWGGGPDPPSSRAHGPSSPASSLRRRPPSTLGSCLSGTLEAVVFTAPSSPIHLRLVECWRFTKDLGPCYLQLLSVICDL